MLSSEVLGQHWLSLRFLDPVGKDGITNTCIGSTVETEHRQWSLGRVLPILLGVSSFLGVSNLFVYVFTTPEKDWDHPTVRAALLMQIILPIIAALLTFRAWWTGSLSKACLLYTSPSPRDRG